MISFIYLLIGSICSDIRKEIVVIRMLDVNYVYNYQLAGQRQQVQVLYPFKSILVMCYLDLLFSCAPQENHGHVLAA